MRKIKHSNEPSGRSTWWYTRSARCFHQITKSSRVPRGRSKNNAGALMSSMTQALIHLRAGTNCINMFLSQKIKTCFTTKRMPNSRISSLWGYFQTEKILSEHVHSQNDLWSLIGACEIKPSKLESMHQQAETCYKSTSYKLRILYLKSFLILNKFLLFREFLKRL